MNTRDDPRNKIERLLRLAEDPGTTQEERDLAMQRALALAEKHQIDAAEIDPHSGRYKRGDIVTHVFPIPTTYGLNSTRTHGVYDVLRAMGGDGYSRQTTGRGKAEELVAYAPEAAMDVLKALLPSLILQEAHASAAYIKYLKANHPGLKAMQAVISDMRAQKADPRDFVNHLNSEIRYRRKSFCLAFFVEAAEKIRKTRKDAVQQAGRGYAMVLVDAADRIAAMLAEVDGLREARPGGKWDKDGWDSGTAAGRQALVGQTEVNGGRLALEG